jgi:hypothetical protein
MAWPSLHSRNSRQHLADNILIIGRSPSATSYSLHVEERFWKMLKDKLPKNGQFVHVEIERLSKEDVILMIAKTIGVEPKDVATALLSEVLMQSGGTPFFRGEILRQWGKSFFGSSQRHRDCSFDANNRLILNIAAALGDFFTLSPIVTVTKANNNANEDALCQLTASSLAVTVHEGILYSRDTPGTLSAINGMTTAI